MSDWTPQRLQQVLDERIPGQLRELIQVLTDAATMGRGILLYKEPWLHGSCDSKEDDVQDLLLYLLRNDARILRKYGEFDGGAESSAHDASPARLDLKRFVIGVAMRFLRKKYASRWKKVRQIHPDALEEVVKDLAEFSQAPVHLRDVDSYVAALELERAVKKLSLEDQARFQMRYIENLNAEESCLRLGITQRNSFDQQMSRMQRKLADLLQPDELGAESNKRTP